MKKSVIFPLLFLLIFFSCSTKHKYYRVHDEKFKSKPRLSIGARNSGIGFGNFQKYYGIRFSLVDHDTLNNGISFNVSSFNNIYKKTNGIELSLISATVDRLNGICFSPLQTDIWKGNGLNITGGLSDNLYFNGIQLTGLISMTYYVNGICFTGIANIIFQEQGILAGGIINIVDSVANGIAICGAFQKIENFNGLCISPVNISKNGKGVQIGLFNKANNFKGVQIGLVNFIKAKNHFKIMPIINFCFRKNQSSANDTIKE